MKEKNKKKGPQMNEKSRKPAQQQKSHRRDEHQLENICERLQANSCLYTRLYIQQIAYMHLAKKWKPKEKN